MAFVHGTQLGIATARDQCAHPITDAEIAILSFQ